MNVLRFGMIRNLVLGLEVVLADASGHQVIPDAKKPPDRIVGNRVIR